MDACGRQRGASAYVEHGHLVSEIDNSHVGTPRDDERVTDTDPRVIEPEVGDETDDRLHGAPCVRTASEKLNSPTLLCSTRPTEVSVSAARRTSLILLVILSTAMLACAAGCSPKGPLYVDTGASYTMDSVDEILRGADAGAYATEPTADATGLRHEALVALRKRGENAAAAADLITRTFPADTRSVPVYVERASVDGKRVLVVVEATGPKGGSLDAKRMWVFDDQGNVIFASTGK